MNAVEKFLYRGHLIKIMRDEDPENPRGWLSLSNMVCWHRRYQLGDKHEFADPEEFRRWLEPLWVRATEDDDDGIELTSRERDAAPPLSEEEHWRQVEGTGDGEGSEVLPLYLMDHGNICMSTRDFRDPWDSGQVGYLYVTREEIIKEYGDDSPESREQVRKLLESEIRTYSDYLEGSVYRYVIRAIKEGEPQDGIEDLTPEKEGWPDPDLRVCTDSCWGFYQDDGPWSKRWGHILSEAKAAIDGDLEHEIKERQKIAQITAL